MSALKDPFLYVTLEEYNLIRPFDINEFRNFEYLIDRARYLYLCMESKLTGISFEKMVDGGDYTYNFNYEDGQIRDIFVRLLRTKTLNIMDYYMLGVWAVHESGFYNVIKETGRDFSMKEYGEITGSDYIKGYMMGYIRDYEPNDIEWEKSLQDIMKEYNEKREFYGRGHSKITELQCQTKLCKDLKRDGYTIYKEFAVPDSGYIDVVAVKPDVVMIVEIKQSGSRDNIRKAFGQVIHYENYFVKRFGVEPDQTVVKIISTPNDIDSNLIEWLNSHGIEYLKIDMNRL